MLYLLTSMYDRVYITKPTVVNMISSERYIVCKNFILNQQTIKTYLEYITNLIFIIKNNTDNNTIIESLLKNQLPYFFINKIEESNIIIGEQQLENIDNILSLYNNKKRDIKLDLIKKNNIQKCIQWCEKFKIPHTKCLDGSNVFLHTF